MDIPSDFSSKSRSTIEFLRRAIVYLKPYKWSASANILCAFLMMGFYFVFPYVTQYIIDTVIAGRKTALLLPAVLCLLGAFLLRDLFNSLRFTINGRLGENVVYDLRTSIYSRMQCLPVNFFDQRASGDLMTRVMNDVEAVQHLLVDGIERAATAFMSVIVVLVILFFKNAALTAIALIPLSILIIGGIWYTMTAHERHRKQRMAAGALSALLMDNLQGIRQIKSFNRQRHEDERFAGRADALRQSWLGVMKVWAIYSPAMNFAGSLGMVLVLWVGGPMVIQGTLTLGELVGFVFYLALFYEPVGHLDGLNQMLQSARAAGERIFDILDVSDENRKSPSPAQLTTPVRGEVCYDKVGFSYDGEHATLKDISLRADPGQMIALVGPTGAGKSTLVNLLPAFYTPTSGRITVDSQDIGELSLESLRSRISVVSQETFLFNGTIAENILYGKLDATEEEMLAAARAANCHEFIVSMPEGYHSRVGERGVKLSVGEKQRISIARALLKNTPILILDEATASVDSATEKLIQEALQRLTANRTSFVIAHRFSTIRNADNILVMRHGEIVERGNHVELLRLGGLYAKLSFIQNEQFIEEYLGESK